MMAEIMAVGTELLMGQIANTNAQYISRRLPEIGIGVFYHSVVGDNPSRVASVLKTALSRADLVIITGGLGPTQDDLTKETVAAEFGKNMVYHPEILDRIRNYFEKTNRPMPENNAKQAYFPEGSIILDNEYGTAPGCILEDGGKTVVMLPGPPSEMIPMFENKVIPHLKARSDFVISSRFLKVFGMGESLLETRLMDLIDGQTNPTLATYAKDGEVTLRITAKASSETEASFLIEPVEREIRKRLGLTVYGTGDDNMEDVVARLLIEKNATLAVAESCTGGLIGDKLTNVPGISSVFERGVICYSNASKVELLGVKSSTLEKYGAVSEQTAVEMADGIRKNAGTLLGLSVTGIAGPGGGTPEKPVGLVYVGFSSPEGTSAMKLTLTGSRVRIKNLAALNALNMVRLYLQEM